jgi:tetratricopeptide (TPR) repeat protein
MDVATLQNLESQGAHPQIERELAAALERGKSPAVLKYASSYYVRRGNPAKSLSCYSAYVQHTPPEQRDLEAVQWAIDCARRIGRSELVRDFFFSLTNRERELLAPASLIQVASAFIAMGQLDEAETILRFVRNRSGAKQLVTFDELISDRFGSLDNARKYASETEPRFDKGDFYTNVKQAVNLALAHMSQGNYSTAENILLSCKAGVAA